LTLPQLLAQFQFRAQDVKKEKKRKKNPEKKNHDSTLNFYVAELSLQKSVYGSASWECKKGFISCICYKNLSSVSAQRHCGRLKSQTWSEKHEQTSNFYVAKLSL
jgi:hypothetical protein